MEKAKRELSKLKAQFASAKTPELSWEAKKLLQLYAQGLTDWQHPPKTWITNYRQALQVFGPEFSNPKGPSSRTVYWLLFMTSFRGGKDSEKAKDSELEFWLLARHIAPKAVEKLLSDPAGLGTICTEESSKFLKVIDKVLAEPDETPKDPESNS